MSVIRVVLAEDEALIRDALLALLGLESDIEVVAAVADGDEAVAAARRFDPDVCVLDLQMPCLDGLSAWEQIHREAPDIRAIIVTSHALPGRIREALEAGVSGFVPKSTSGAQLAVIIRDVHAGHRYVDPELAASALSCGSSPLTVREADALDAARDGAVINEVARRLGVSAGTARNYVSTAMTKLHAATRHEACTIAERKGWI